MIDLGNYKDYLSEGAGKILSLAIEESKKRDWSTFLSPFLSGKKPFSRR